MQTLQAHGERGSIARSHAAFDYAKDKSVIMKAQSSADISDGTNTVVPVIFKAADTLEAVLFIKMGHLDLAVSICN